MTTLTDPRQNNIFGLSPLCEAALDPDPIRQFERWFEQALKAQLPNPNAMILATVADNRPSARIVLMKSIDARGLVFFTNYHSRKARELAQNPWASLVFYWTGLERQVRIEGLVHKTSEAESDAYFDSRPLGSKIGAWASEQSALIAHRAVLEARAAQFAVQLNEFGEHPPRPPHWGGYRLCPEAFEFWQAQPSRLHDRLQYRRDGDSGWRIVRLCP